jgi:DNA-binding NtrC family response regulator
MSTTSPIVMIVDDEPDMLRLLERSVAETIGCRVITAGGGEEALQELAAHDVDLALLDIRMPGMDGLQLLDAIRERDPGLAVIMMTAYGAIEIAVEAIRKGAYDFITKPFDHDELIHHLRNALERGRLLRENRELQARVREAQAFQNLVGASPAMQKVFDSIETLSQTDITVLITGASGTGKNLAARALHDLSRRKGKPFIRVNCPTVPENILESELFGYARGAFTHAVADRRGLFQEGDGGTVFLDEIGDISPAIQTKLLQVLEDKEFRPLGRTGTVKVDVRVIAASNRDLKAKMARGEFREDLYYRLCVVELPMPALNARREDIPLLVEYFLAKYGREYGREQVRPSPDLLQQCQKHDWQGNVRELENTLRRGLAMTSGSLLTPQDVGWRKEGCVAAIEAEALTDVPYREAKDTVLAQFNRRYITEALRRTGGNVSQAARLSNIERQSFQQVMKKCGIRAEGFREGAKK